MNPWKAGRPDLVPLSAVPSLLSPEHRSSSRVLRENAPIVLDGFPERKQQKGFAQMENGKIPQSLLADLLKDSRRRVLLKGEREKWKIPNRF